MRNENVFRDRGQLRLVSGQEIDEPVSLTEAKTWLREASNDQDAVISRLIVTARRLVELHTKRQLVSANWRWTNDRFPPGQPIILRRPPISEIVSVKYRDEAGELQTLSSDRYEINLDTEPGELHAAYGTAWPTARRMPGAVEVIFTAGYGDAEDVPDTAKQAMQFLIQHWYDWPDEMGRMSDLVVSTFEALISDLQWTL